MDTKPTGFEFQEEYDCGPFALSHALNLIGIPSEMEDMRVKSRYVAPKSFLGGMWKLIYDDNLGTDEKGIKSAIKKIGATKEEYHSDNPTEALIFIDNNLSKGYPIIMFVNYSQDYDDDGHWMVCAGKLDDYYVIIDSAPDGYEKIDFYDEEELLDRFVWYEEDYEEEDEWYYDIYLLAVKPNNTPSCVKNISKFCNELMSDEDLQEWWGFYLNDLLDISNYSFGNTEGKILLSEIIEKHQEKIFESISYWLEEIDEEYLEYEIENYKIVANAYEFSVPESAVEETILSFVCSLIGTCLYYN